jgi:c(7)-type cytochrome triheme protein
MLRKPVPCLLFLVAILAAQMPVQEKKPAAKSKQVAEVVIPAKLVFAAKPGKVTFNHAAHVKREKNDCKVCHDSLWPRDAKAPLNFKSPMHQTMQENKTSCSFCHAPGGKAFPAKGNCTSRCHGVAAAAAAAAAKE